MVNPLTVTGNATVDAVSQIQFQGDVIPFAWYQNIQVNKKPDLNAIVLLGRILYWYRPSIVMDEETGVVLGYKRKFKADLLQQSYDAFSNYFGFSKKQVKEATDRLVELGVITKHFRTIEVNNQKLSNVLFIELHVEKLAKISKINAIEDAEDMVEGHTPQGRGVIPHKVGGSYPTGGEGHTPQGGTNTKTTTKITTYINKKDFAEKLEKELMISDQQIDAQIILKAAWLERELKAFERKPSAKSIVDEDELVYQLADHLLMQYRRKYRFENKTTATQTVKTLSEKQIAVFAGKLACLPEFSSMAEPGESLEDFSARIAQKLKDPAQQKAWAKQLHAVGYKGEI